jgi:hypothetical protein
MRKTHFRDSLYEELKDDLVDLMKSRYAVFFVMKLIKHGSKEQKAHVFKVAFSSLPGANPTTSEFTTTAPSL